MKNILKPTKYLQRGDTIVEVLISVMILSLVMVVAFVSTSRSLQQGTGANNRQQATSYAEQQVELIKNAVISSPQALAKYESPTAFCIDPSNANTAPNYGYNAATSSFCKNVGGQYTISNSYAGGLFTVNPTWQSPGSQDTLSVYYRVSSTALYAPAQVSLTALAPCDNPASPVNVGQQCTLQWNVKFATSCTASGANDWNNTVTVDPSDGIHTHQVTLSAANTTYTYNISCVNGSGTPATGQVIIKTNPLPPPPPPTVNFCVDSGSDCSSGGYTSTSATINDSDQAVLRWHVLNANAGCNSTGSDLPWGSPGGDSTSSAQTDPLSGGAPDGPGSDYTFTLKCSNTAGQSVTQTVTVHAKATTGSGPCSNNCGSPGPGTSCTSAVNVSWDGSENPDGSLSWSAWDDPDCSYGIHYCDAETDATAYGIFDNGNDNPLNTSSGSGYPNDPNVVRIGCEDLAGNWGWSDSYPTGGNPGSPGTNPYWVSKGISYYGVKGGEVSKGISSWCNDSDAGHGYLVCGVYVTGNESYCSLSWRANGSTFQENQYNGVVDTTNSPPSKYNDSGNPSPNPPGFVLGFPNAAYVITDGKAPILDVACNGLSDFVWSPKSYPVGT